MVKKYFFSKTAQKCMIKNLFFFPDFLRLQGWVGGSDQIWKIPDFFFLIEPFPIDKLIVAPSTSTFLFLLKQ